MLEVRISDYFLTDTFAAFSDNSGHELNELVLTTMMKGDTQGMLYLLSDVYEAYCNLYGDDLEYAKIGLTFQYAQISCVLQRGLMPIVEVHEVLYRYFRIMDDLENVHEIICSMCRMLMEYTTKMQAVLKEKECSFLVRECCEYIRNHIMEDVSVEVIAAQMHFSTSYISRKFREEKGISIGRYILQEKIIASKLLLNGNTPIAEIADILHFSSQSHYTQVFKQFTGTTPKAFRKSLLCA